MRSSRLVLEIERSKRLEKPLITLTTDFGISDYFVGSLKGVLLQGAPSAQIIDLTHQLPRHDILSAAFVINEAFRYFPTETIHLVIVDPGVGTKRRKIVVSYKDQSFVAPDNGVLTYILQKEGSQSFEINESTSLKFEESPTFAGRDHFAPITALLASGTSPSTLGLKINDAYELKGLRVKQDGALLIGKIVYFDQYGNAITNLRRSCLGRKIKDLKLFTADVKGETLREIKQNYSEGEKGKGNFVINSSGYLEIFSPQNSVKALMKLNLMDEVIVP